MDSGWHTGLWLSLWRWWSREACQRHPGSCRSPETSGQIARIRGAVYRSAGGAGVRSTVRFIAGSGPIHM